MVRARLIVAAAVLLATLARTRLARADDDLSALLAEPVETTASKSAGTAASAPALSISVTAEDLRRYGVHTLAEAYNFLTMGLVSEDPLGEPEVGGRGLMFTTDQSKHILLLIDGHSTNNQETGASLHGRSLGLPFEIIDHIEVVIGPGSVLYGANAMLGVVNVVTKRAKDFSGVHAVVEAATSPPTDRAHAIVSPSLTSRYLQDLGKGYRLALGGGREFGLRGRTAELTGELEYYTLDGPTMAWGPQSFPGVNYGQYGTRGAWGGLTTRSYFARVPSGYARLMVGELEVAVHGVASNISHPYHERTAPSLATDFDDPDGATTRRYLGLDVKWHTNVSTVASVLARFYADSASEDAVTHSHAFGGCVDTQPEVFCAITQSGYARWLGTELQWTFDWTKDGRVTTMIGADARVRRVGYANGLHEVLTGRGLVHGTFNGTQELGAVYAQQVYRVLPWLTVNGGLRFDADSLAGSRLVPRAAVVAEPWTGATLKALYSQAFRAPTADEISYRNPLSEIQSQDLRPESVRSIEAVLEQRFGTQNIVFGVFRSWWTDMVIRRQFYDLQMQPLDEGRRLVTSAKRAGLIDSYVQTAFQYQNVPTIDSFGFNGGYDGTLLEGQLAYGLNLTAGHARFNTPTGSRRVAVTPSIFGNARVSYDFANRLPIIALAAHFSGRRLSDAGEDAGFSPAPYAPAALDLRMTVTGPFPRMPGLKYQLMSNYAVDSSGPYTAGPASTAPIFQPRAELIPTVRLTVMLGLEYHFDPHH